MVAASQGLPTQNPAFHVPQFIVVRPAGRTRAEANLEHPKDPDAASKASSPCGKQPSISFLRPSSRATLYASPAKQPCAELSPVPLVAFAAKWLPGEPVIAFGWVCLGDNNAAWHKKRRQGAVKRPHRNSVSVPQGRNEHVAPACDCGLADLIAGQRPEEAARLFMSVAAPPAAAQQGLDCRDAVGAKR
jgi:hypothetical protein